MLVYLRLHFFEPAILSHRNDEARCVRLERLVLVCSTLDDPTPNLVMLTSRLSDSVVISLFAIVILSVLGSLYGVCSCHISHQSITSPNLRPESQTYIIISIPRRQALMTSSSIQSNNHSFTGSEGEPEDGAAVAASIYTAVIVYVVRQSPPPLLE